MQSPVKKDPELDRRVQQLLARMTVEEKVGQVVQGDIASVTPEDVRKYRLGSVLAGGNSDPGSDFHATAGAMGGAGRCFLPGVDGHRRRS